MELSLYRLLPWLGLKWTPLFQWLLCIAGNGTFDIKLHSSKCTLWKLDVSSPSNKIGKKYSDIIDKKKDWLADVVAWHCIRGKRLRSFIFLFKKNWHKVQNSEVLHISWWLNWKAWHFLKDEVCMDWASASQTLLSCFQTELQYYS